jgi:hypothetical protein
MPFEKTNPILEYENEPKCFSEKGLCKRVASENREKQTQFIPQGSKPISYIVLRTAYRVRRMAHSALARTRFEKTNPICRSWNEHKCFLEKGLCK